MADDKSKKDYRDRVRINVKEPYEVTYWSKRFGCTRTELLAAVRKVGVMVEKVRKEIAARK
jgi:hypothetical protein